MARQPLGQHFLADSSWRSRILRVLPVRAGDLWLEIGAGHGEMTAELARAGARVVAVELDPRLADSLDSLAARTAGVEVVAGDVLKLDLAAVTREPRFCVYGNLPYYITSPILHRLFAMADRIETICVVVQLEVAARLAARPGRRDYGYLSVLAQYYAGPEILLHLPPGAFRPRPRVASALVRMPIRADREFSTEIEEKRFLEFVQACFAQKRKTLLNNLRARLYPERSRRVPPDAARTLLQSVGIAERARAEELTVEEFAALFRALPR